MNKDCANLLKYGALFLAGTLMIAGVVLRPFCLADGDDYENQKQYDTAATGHMKPLGQQRRPEGFVDTVTGFLDAKRFFADYVQQNEPVIFKGAAKRMPAFRLWTDAYFIEKFGRIPVSVEEGKKENRSDKNLLMPFSQFLQVYESEDIYMVQDLIEPFHSDLSLPPCLSCGGFERSLEVGVIWFSSGGTQSVLHLDDVDNINCLLDGKKEFVLIDREYDYLVEAENWEDEGTYSNVDVSAVDLNQYPSLGEVPWWKAEVEAGDCIFIPYRWYHAVHSLPGRNLAINLFFAHLLWLDEKQCDTKAWHPGDDYTSLTEYRINSLHPEHVAIEKMRCDIFEVFEGEQNISLEDVIDVWEDVMDPSEIQELFETIDADKDMVWSWREIYSTDVLSLLGDFPLLLPENADEHQHTGKHWKDARDGDTDHQRDEL